MKTKLYTLALLALFTCGLCLALPSVRHAASELITAAFKSSPPIIRAAVPQKPLTHAKGTEVSSITITPITTGANGERCAILFSSSSILELKIPSNDDLCKVRVQWYLADADRTDSIGLIRERYGNAVDISPIGGGRGGPLPQSGEFIDELSPVGSQGYTYMLNSRQYVSNGAQSVVNHIVKVADHVDFDDGMNHPFNSLQDAQCNGLNAINTSAGLLSTAPGRWAGQVVGNNFSVVRQFPGTSYDFEFKAATVTEPLKVRATWYTFDNLYRPIWLQTQWMPADATASTQGAIFYGELRRYRWNPKVGLRTGGKKVGYLKGQLYKPGIDSFSQRILVERYWREPGVTDNLAGQKLQESECLIKNNYPVSKAAINDAFGGVWGSTYDDPNAETDSAIFEGLYEFHMLRIWDQSGAPIWLHGVSSALTQQNTATLPMNYVKSPYLKGFPLTQIYNGDQLCGPAGCNVCEIPVGSLTRSHNIESNGYSTFNIAGYKINLQMAANQPAPAQCWQYNQSSPNYTGPLGMANPAISWNRPGAPNLYNYNLPGDFARFQLPSLGPNSNDDGRVVAAPLEARKGGLDSPSTFNISWAMSKPGTYRLMRQNNDLNTVRLVQDNITQIGTFSDSIYIRATATLPAIVPFEGGSYQYFVEKQIGAVYVKSGFAAQVYVRNPPETPILPTCLNIVPRANGATAPCDPHQDISVATEAPLTAIFARLGAPITFYGISEQKIVGGLAQAGCHGDSLGVNNDVYSGPNPSRMEFTACAEPGEYLYRVFACIPPSNSVCGPAYPVEGIRVLVGGAQTIPAPTNVIANAEGTALGYSVSWTPPATTLALTYTIARKALSTPPAATQTPAPPSGAASQTTTSSTITGTETLNGTYYFWVQACANTGTLCSQWSQPSSGLTLPVVASVPLPPQLFPAASAPPTAAEIAASSKVGSLDGSLRVGESGAVNFSMDFVTAPGKGGLVPEIGLAYSGDTSLGIAGVGFNLTGLSAVSRCRKTIEAGDGPGPHPQVNFDADASNDAYCLDGQRLFQVATGTQTIDGTSYPYAEFRTEIETFQRVRAYASTASATGEQLVYGPLFWRVEAKDGSIRDYGRGYSDLVTNAAVYANDGRWFSSVKPQRLVTASRSHIVSWALAQHADRLGNRIRFHYETGHVGSEVDPFLQHFLSRVFYTGFIGSSAQRFEHAAIAFDYVAVPLEKVRFGWVSGTYSEQKVELSRVRSCLRTDPSVAISSGELDPNNTSALCASTAKTPRIYNFGYTIQTELPGATAGINAPKIGSGQSRLSTIQTCADIAGTTCWPMTTLEWSNARAGFDNYATGMGGAEFQRAAAIRFTDVTGDGRPDAIWREQLTDHQGDKIWFTRAVANAQNGTSFVQGSVQITSVPDDLDNDLYGNDPDRNWALLDVDGDGLEDLITSEQVTPDYSQPNWWNQGPFGWFVRRALGTNAGFSASRTPLETAGPVAFNQFGLPAITAQFQLTDTNGDGVQDLIFPRRTSVGGPLRTILQFSAGKRELDGRIVFQQPEVVRLDFGTGQTTSCYTVSFGRKHRADNWDSQDFNGDSSADLTLQVEQTPNCVGRSSMPEGYEFNSVPPAALLLNREAVNSASNPAANSAGWSVFIATTGSSFRRSLNIAAADAEGAFRLVDLNGDGASDVVFQESTVGNWLYLLNRGDGEFGAAFCLIPAPGVIWGCTVTSLPNNTADTLQMLLQDYDGDGFTDVWLSEKDPIANPISDDGRRFRVYR